MKQMKAHNAIIHKLVLLGVVWAGLAAGGCRAAPSSLAGMLVGDVVSDVDVSGREEKLLGQPETAADEMFGERMETFDDVQQQGVTMVAYPVKFDLLKKSRYVVEVTDGKIVALSKTKQNIDGSEDMIKAAALKKKVIGKTPAQSQADAELDSPVRTLRSREKQQLVNVYDVRNWTNLRGARYCVLRFGGDNLCEDIKLVGVSASTD